MAGEFFFGKSAYVCVQRFVALEGQRLLPELDGALVLGLDAAATVLPLEFKRTQGVGDLLVHCLVNLEQ
jgi:hypothetical protein